MNPVRLGELVALAAYDFDGRNEAEIRGDWIEPLLRLLGYGLGTRHDILREREFALRPPSRMIGSTKVEIDFIPTVFGQRLWIIEAKRPQAGDGLFSDKHLGQAWSYATDRRIAVPLMVLCDGTRLGIFDLTRVEWDTPVFDRPKADLPDCFDDLIGWLGARRVAERVRQRQLSHLQTALEAQVDLGALDQTLDEVKEIVDRARLIVTERRDDIQRQARDDVQARGSAARDAVGIWGLAQELNGPLGVSIGGWQHGAELIRRRPLGARIREFDAFETATTPPGKHHPRMWFWLQAARMACAVVLAEDEDCGPHCRSAATEAARDHASGFADDPLKAAAYRLQRLLGPLGWRIAANAKPHLDSEAARLVELLDAEEWLRLDAIVGLTAYNRYKQVALLTPRMLLVRVDPWDVETVAATADQVERLLELLPKPDGLAHLQPAGDPWGESWLRTDLLRAESAAILKHLDDRTDTPAAVLARELYAAYYD